jgi:hypothetical protein
MQKFNELVTDDVKGQYWIVGLEFPSVIKRPRFFRNYET